MNCVRKTCFFAYLTSYRTCSIREPHFDEIHNTQRIAACVSWAPVLRSKINELIAANEHLLYGGSNDIDV